MGCKCGFLNEDAKGAGWWHDTIPWQKQKRGFPVGESNKTKAHMYERT